MIFHLKMNYVSLFLLHVLLHLIRSKTAHCKKPPLSSPVTVEPRIVGGETTEIERFPFLVSIQKAGVHYCGGSILNHNYVLTAGHCGHALHSGEPNDVQVLAGSTFDASVAPNLLKVNKFHLHPGFKSTRAGLRYDVAVANVDGSFDFNPRISPVTLPASLSDASVTIKRVLGKHGKCSVMGWGITRDAMSLRKVDIPLIPFERCAHVLPDLDKLHHLCTLDNGKDACQGDSGGPLICEGVQVAIVSFGYGCGEPGIPGVYQRVDTSLDWISEKVGLHPQDT